MLCYSIKLFINQLWAGPWLCDKTLAATLEDRSSIPGAGNNNVLVTISDWPTLVSSVFYASLVSAYAYRDFKPGSKCWGCNTV